MFFFSIFIKKQHSFKINLWSKKDFITRISDRFNYSNAFLLHLLSLFLFTTDVVPQSSRKLSAWCRKRDSPWNKHHFEPDTAHIGGQKHPSGPQWVYKIDEKLAISSNNCSYFNKTLLKWSLGSLLPKLCPRVHTY